ncbi:hypothetical protein COJ48_21615 [Bacillus cereus]|nr:hypothetical protein COJ48_21615 [Bacillus cereus]
MFNRRNIHIRVVDKDGEVYHEFDVSKVELEEIKENKHQVRMVKENVYEIVESDENLDSLGEELEELEEIMLEIEQEQAEEKAKQKEKQKWSTKKKVIVFGLIFIVFIVLPIIEGFQNAILVDEGKPMEAQIVGRHVEKEKIIFTHPTLEIFVDGKYEDVWVRTETYNEAEFGSKVRVVKKKDGDIVLDPRYDYEDLIVK